MGMKEDSTKKTSFNFDKNLLKELKLQSFESEVTQTELIHRYIKEGLYRDKNGDVFEMNNVIIESDLMDRLSIKSNLINIDINELANKYISQGLDNDNVIPDKVSNPEDFKKLLDHDKPEGDDTLKKITGIIDVKSNFNAVELKKLSQTRYID